MATTQKTAKAASKGTFSGLGDILKGGFSSQLADEGAPRQMFKLADIEVEPQIRTEMEDPEQTLEDLGKDLRIKQLQPVLLRKNRPGREKPYLLVAGERRVRAGLLEGLAELWGDYLGDIDDETAKSYQAKENIHRKNLTQFELARRVKEDVDSLGVEATLVKYNKGKPWLSKILALNDLPDATRRLVAENITADLEVIHNIRVTEGVNPEAAAAAVEVLKAGSHDGRARDYSVKVKDEVKPSKKKAEAKRQQQESAAKDGSIATPRDKSAELPGEPEVRTPGSDRKGKKNGVAEALEADVARAALVRDYSNLFEFGSDPKTLIDCMASTEREAVETWLRQYYDAGKGAKGLARGVMLGFRNGQFATDGVEAFALAAFLMGGDFDASFNLLDIYGAIKQ